MSNNSTTRSSNVLIMFTAVLRIGASMMSPRLTDVRARSSPALMLGADGRFNDRFMIAVGPPAWFKDQVHDSGEDSDGSTHGASLTSTPGSPKADEHTVFEETCLAEERVPWMDVDHNDGYCAHPDTEYTGKYFTVNGKRYDLRRHTRGPLEGTVLTYPRYDQKALCTMYDENYFGDKATLQVGIPDRSDGEVARRQAMSNLQINEWKAASIQVAGKTVLEIGGGSGYLSQAVNWDGGDATNVEMCEERCIDCESRGIKAFAGELSDAIKQGKFTAGSVDIVACYDLLEHIIDPVQFVKDVRYVLRDGGHLVLRVPDTPVEGPTLHLVDHVNHFSRESLCHLMSSEGMEFVKRPVTTKIPAGHDQYYSGTFWADDNTGRNIVNMTMFFQKTEDTNDHVVYTSKPKTL